MWSGPVQITPTAIRNLADGAGFRSCLEARGFKETAPGPEACTFVHAAW